MIRLEMPNAMVSAIEAITDDNGRAYWGQVKDIINRWPRKFFELQDMRGFHPDRLGSASVLTLLSCTDVFVLSGCNHCVAVNGVEGYVMDNHPDNPLAVNFSPDVLRTLAVWHAKRVLTLRRFP
jgi:hypothetical protein